MDKKSPSKQNFLTFERLDRNSTNSSCHISNHKSVFLKFLHHSSLPWEITLLYFFSWNFVWFGQKEPIKVQNFRLSTAHVKFHQIFTLIGSFYWKYIKFQLRSTEDLGLMRLKMMQNLKRNFEWFVVPKMTKIWWILTWALKVPKISTLIDSFCAKYIKFDLKKSKVVVFHKTGD